MYRPIHPTKENQGFEASIYLLYDAFEHNLYGDCVLKDDKITDCWTLDPTDPKGQRNFTTKEDWQTYTGLTYMSD